MADQDEFFTPEEVDRQIERVSQFKEGERTDAEAAAFLRSFYRTNAAQEQESLDRMWNRIARALPPEQDSQERENLRTTRRDQYGTPGTMGRARPDRRRHARLVQRLGVLAATIILIALVGSMAIVFYAAHHPNGGTSGPHPTVIATTVPTKTPTTGPTTTPVPLQVVSVTMSVTPASIAGIACGTHLTVTYTATFHVTPGSAGGTVQFGYTINNGRSQSMASIHFQPGETVKTYTFTWSGSLPADHTSPEPGGVQVFSPNQLTSQLVGPSGMCS
jgi:hypothetical protein